MSLVNDTQADQIASGIAWMHQDPKGVHVDSKTALVCVVSYLGPGPLLYSPFDVVDRSESTNLTLQPGSPVFRTPTNWPVFIKGRADLSQPPGPNNFGLPHESPNSSDLICGFDRRLIFAVQAYGAQINTIEAVDLNSV